MMSSIQNLSLWDCLVLLLLYGESLMVALHLWILIGIISLPTLEVVDSQPPASKYMYLACDASLPILAAYVTYSSSSGEGPKRSNRMAPLLLVGCLVVAHTILYAAFAWDESNMEEVTLWAYSSWEDRANALSIFPGGAAVCLDAMCHGWGLSTLLLCIMASPTEKQSEFAWTVCAAGAAVGACTMTYLSH